jgi:hypothetical protein
MALDKKKASKTKADMMLEAESEAASKNLVELTLETLGADKKTDIAETSSPSPQVVTGKMDGHSVSESNMASRMEPVSRIPAQPEKKNPTGRPSNASKGLKKKKQYTVFLYPHIHDKIEEIAMTKDISFSKMMENILREYVEKYI